MADKRSHSPFSAIRSMSIVAKMAHKMLPDDANVARLSQKCGR